MTYALLPVWLLNTTWNGQNFVFAMNGQTGKMAGDLPLDKAAYKKWLLGLTGIIGTVLSVIFLLLYLVLLGLLLPREPFGLVALALAFGIAFIISLIATGIMRWKLKTVHSQSGTDDSMKQGSMQLTKKNDLLLYRHVERKGRKREAQIFSLLLEKFPEGGQKWRKKIALRSRCWVTSL